ncbi:MAG TPA: redox-sensing transcriptional repressor Rex [Bacteroidales bacterium]|nr:redox-sensing transcriptional repressor Rex [Bacteroidales bacterium]
MNISTKKLQPIESVIVPEPTLRRLPGYLSYFKAINASKIELISSGQIAKTFKVDSTLITKDLAYTGVKGRTKVGYKVGELIEKLEAFLDYRANENAFLFGVGNLGKALIKYEGLKEHGLKIVAAFDVDSQIINTTINDVRVYAIDEFRDLSRKIPARIGIITTPDKKAQETADILVAWGMKAIWNFTPQSIKVPDNIVVEKTSIYSDLTVILHKLKRRVSF